MRNGTLAIIALVATSACGGGGSSGSSPIVNSAPIVNAGVDQEVYADLTLELSAAASDSDAKKKSRG